MLTSELAYVAAVTRDIDAAADVLGNVLELPRADVPGPGRDVPVFTAGRSALALFEIGDPGVDGAERTGIHHIALGAGDAAAARDAAAVAGVSAGPPRPALGGGEAFDLDPAETRGVLTRISPPLDLPPPSGWVERSITSGSRPTTAPAPRRASRAGSATKWRAGSTTWRCPSRSRASPPTSTASSTTTGRPGGSGAGASSSSPSATPSSRSSSPSSSDQTPPRFRTASAAIPGRTWAPSPASWTAAGPGSTTSRSRFRTPTTRSGRAREAGCRMIDDRGRPGSRRAMIGFIHPAALGGILVHFDAREEL